MRFFEYLLVTAALGTAYVATSSLLLLSLFGISLVLSQLYFVSYITFMVGGIQRRWLRLAVVTAISLATIILSVGIMFVLIRAIEALVLAGVQL